MAVELEADPIDGRTFYEIEVRCVAELNRAHASVERLKQLDECAGEA